MSFMSGGRSGRGENKVSDVGVLSRRGRGSLELELGFVVN